MPGPEVDPTIGLESSLAALKGYEPDRYYAALLTPRDRRQDLIALVAFAAELGRVAAEVSEPMVGEIRLQWWADAVQGTRSGVKTGNPVADDFAAVAHKHDLPQQLIDGMIDAVRAQIFARAPENLADLVPGLVAFEGGLFTASVMIVNGKDRPEVQLMAKSAAIAYGLARLLYATALRQPEAGIEAPLSEALARELHKEAHLQLMVARDRVAGLTRASKTLFLPLALVEPYLRSWKLNRDGMSRSHERARLSQLRRMWLIWRSHMTGRF